MHTDRDEVNISAPYHEQQKNNNKKYITNCDTLMEEQNKRLTREIPYKNVVF